MGNKLHDHKNVFKHIGCILVSSKLIERMSRGEVIYSYDIPSSKEGLYDPKIFGPGKFYWHKCDNVLGFCRRSKDEICEYCKEIIKKVPESILALFGHIGLTTPVCNCRYYKVMAILLDIPEILLLKIVNYNVFVVTKVDKKKKDEFQRQIKLAYNTKLKNCSKDEKTTIVENYYQSLMEIKNLREKRFLNIGEYWYLAERYKDIFEANTGPEAILKCLEKIDLQKEIKKDLNKLNKIDDDIVKYKCEIRIKTLKQFLMFKVDPSWMVMQVIPILSPAFRPSMIIRNNSRETKTFSDLTLIYRQIISLNNFLERLINSNAPINIVNNQKIRLQFMIDRLYNHDYFINSMNQSINMSASLTSQFIIEQRLQNHSGWKLFWKEAIHMSYQFENQENIKLDWMSKYGGNPLLIENLEFITDEQALWLSELNIKILNLKNLSKITDNQVKLLSSGVSYESLYLPKIESLTDKQADYFSKISCYNLYLDGILLLSDYQARLLSDFSRKFFDQDNVKEATLSLNNLKEINKNQAEFLATFSGKRLSIGVRFINNDLLSSLMKFNGELLSLKGIEKISSEQINILLSFKGEKIILNETIVFNEEQLKMFANNNIMVRKDRYIGKDEHVLILRYMCYQGL